MRAMRKLLAVAALTAVLQPATAGVVSLNFEDLTTVGQIGDRYASSLGISFTGDAWGLTSKFNGCTGDALFSRPGSCGGLQLALDPTDDSTNGTQSFILNLAGGFITEFSFVYSALPASAVQIQLFSGANGTGHVLQTLSKLNGSDCATPGILFCDWTSTSMQFDGTAFSLKVTGLDQSLMLDDLTFNTPSTGGGQLPEPASVALALGALGAAGWARRRSTR